MNSLFHHFFYRRTVLALIFFIIVVVFAVVGCNRVTRHKILTFFFEGVPPLDGKKPSGIEDVNVIMMTNVTQQEVAEPNKTKAVAKSEQKRPSRHKFARDCAQCHTGGLKSGHHELREPLPDLCYSCHADLHDEGDKLHGPLFVGECVFCHDAHQSQYIHLQKAPQPQLCYNCHYIGDVATIVDHQDWLNRVCSDCHDPHGSSIPKLLKSGGGHQDEKQSIDNE